MSHDGNHLLTPREVAARLALTVSALERMRRERRGPAYVRVGRLVRYAPEDLARYIAEQRVEPGGVAL
jgi:excisionase family DNA binding protein